MSEITTIAGNLTEGINANVGFLNIAVTVLTSGIFAIALGYIFMKGGIRTCIRVITAIVH